MLVTFILAMNVFEFLFVTLPYVFSFLYFVFQLPDHYFHILHIVYLCRIVSSNQISSCKWVSYSMISFIKLQWYAAIIKKTILKCSNLTALTILLFFYSTIIFLLLVQHGDIEINPGPKKKQPKYFSCCHWNVNSLLAHDKISLLTAYNTIHQFDVICVAETFVDSLVSLDDRNLSIQGYSLIRADHPDDVKRGGICLYFKENLTLKVIDNFFIAQCIVCEITLQNQKGYVVVTYRSPSQSITEFDEFLSNFDKLLNHIKQFRPSFIIILGDFNTRFKSWWPDDVTSHEGTHVESLTTIHGLQKRISDPNHLLPNSSSCTDLMFTDQPNLAVDSGVHLSFHVKCHHQIIHCKFNLMIVHSPPYERLVSTIIISYLQIIHKTPSWLWRCSLWPTTQWDFQ